MACWFQSADIPTQQLEQFREVRLILGDQLNAQHSWFKNNDAVLYVMFEMRQETDYVKHHVQKVVAFFAAMRAFADALGTKAEVLYLRLDNPTNTHDLCTNIQHIMKITGARKFSYQEPDEYRLEQQLNSIALDSNIAIECYSGEHFLINRSDVQEYLPANKAPLMENFYRRIRKETGYLMDGGKPLGGKWNYDQHNRNKLPDDVEIPPLARVQVNASHIHEMLKQEAVETIGEIDATALQWPIGRRQSLELLRHFIKHSLPHFGEYQDAMSRRGWLLFHSRLSFSLNTKMINPREVVDAAIGAHKNDPKLVTLTQVEGFVRQIIGWREFVRLIYWREMPSYKKTNYFKHTRPLPSLYWNANTKMNCMQHSVQQSLQYAYAHHIQRLMVTGNFALLTGVNPDEIDAWYLGIYTDAIEWVELPNTRGMSQFADGGLLATKPYISSGNYINKMSSYCKSCFYDVKAKTGTRSCPFNSLYWNFIAEHREQLEGNHRMAMMYRQWDKQSADNQKAILAQAQQHLINIEHL